MDLKGTDLGYILLGEDVVALKCGWFWMVLKGMILNNLTLGGVWP